MQLNHSLTWSEAFTNNASELVESGYYEHVSLCPTPPSLKRELREFTVIAEIKPASPSQGVMFTNAVERIQELGPVASAMSVLTEPSYFGGRIENLCLACRYRKPVLMKDIVLFREQIIPHASAVLLIYRFLSPLLVMQLSEAAHSLGVEVLLEVDNVSHYLEAVELPVDIIGVNNRDLQTMEVNPKVSEDVLSLEVSRLPTISMSGFSTREQVQRVKDLGAAGVIVGTALSRSSRPSKTLEELTP